MNKELSLLLRNRLVKIPFMHVMAGMVQVLTVEVAGEVTKIVKDKFPVSTDVIGLEGCKGKEFPMIPNSSYKSILYFEDYGVKAGESHNDLREYTSNLRLVMWLNRKLLTGDSYSPITAVCIDTIINKLCPINPINEGIFTTLKIKPGNIPVQDERIFSPYTYDITNKQMLRPPFEFFAIDLVCSYKLSKDCINQINFLNPNICNV